MKTAYLALGSNLGDRWQNLASALGQLAEGGAVAITKCSSVYETAPMGVTDQPDFLNLVIEVQTTLTPEQLLTHCLETENQLGRVRRERWGPRVIDVDVLWCDDQRMALANLSLPHPRMLERGFVLIPLAEIAPELLLDGETAASRAVGVGEVRIQKLNRKMERPGHHNRSP